MLSYNEKLNRISIETKDVDLSILNGIRRILLMDIPILGFIGNGIDSTVNIIENTTVLNNEIIANTKIGSAAYNAGLEKGDKIVKIASHEIKTTSDLNKALSEVQPNKTIKILYEKLLVGAPVILDDYCNSELYRDQKNSWDKFIEEKGMKILSLPTGQGLFFKI